jgi:hypothetical protein
MTRLPFLQNDNATTLGLLREHTVLMSSDLVARLTLVDSVAGVDEVSALTINQHLRGLLVELIEELPDTSAGQNARKQIALQLKQRVATDPALQRRK